MTTYSSVFEVKAMYRIDLAVAYGKPSTKIFSDWLNRMIKDPELKAEIKGLHHFSARQVARIYKHAGPPSVVYREPE
ncbi:MAG: hypothetical protein JWP57_4311 [Spirosoma sp.]|nr:hypothetical protein [Spirosoma sp.]